MGGLYTVSSKVDRNTVKNRYATATVTVNDPTRAPLDCTLPADLGGGILLNGNTIQAFNATTECPGDCVSINRKCENGILLGDSAYKYKTCDEKYRKIDGKCGSANGKTFSSAPTSNLCDSGNVLAPTPKTSGGWQWNCLPTCGGTIAGCSTGTGSSTSPVSPDVKWIEVPAN
jgi:hypothetical protein